MESNGTLKHTEATVYLAPTRESIVSAKPLTLEEAAAICAGTLKLQNPESQYVRTCLISALTRPPHQIRTTGNPDGVFCLNVATEEGRSLHASLTSKPCTAAHAEQFQAVA